VSQVCDKRGSFAQAVKVKHLSVTEEQRCPMLSRTKQTAHCVIKRALRGLHPIRIHGHLAILQAERTTQRFNGPIANPFAATVLSGPFKEVLRRIQLDLCKISNAESWTLQDVVDGVASARQGARNLSFKVKACRQRCQP